MKTDVRLNQFLDYLNDIQLLSLEANMAVSGLFSIVEVKKGVDLQSIGKTCKTIYFVMKGAARVYYYKNDKDVTEHFAFENDLIIRAESLFTGEPSHKAIQAISDTTFISIPADQLFLLFNTFFEVERLFRKIVEQSYVETVNRLESLQFHSAEERYLSLLQKSPEVVRQIPLKHIASYLGITQVSLSRIRAAIT